VHARATTPAFFTKEKSESAAPVSEDRANGDMESRNATPNAQRAAPSPREQAKPIAITRDLIRDVQRQLNDLAAAGLAVDGIWGKHTSTALKDYQEKHGLAASGQLNRPTLAALGVSPAQQTAGR
jgi:peptidoglycan hydrolase-like protein with peptidoglycan-binding domain